MMSATTITALASHSSGRFIRHYVEMVVATFLGMVVLAVPAGWLFSLLGTSWYGLSPAMMLFAMAVTMTAPMVGWMRYCGHAWRPTSETAALMLAAMLLRRDEYSCAAPSRRAATVRHAPVRA